jgi:hypothetical protein
MQCQTCTKTATHHVTEIVDGQFVEFHVCEAHLPELDKLKAAKEQHPAGGPMAFWNNADIYEAMRDQEARKKLAAHLLPALCLALLDAKPELKILATFWLAMLGSQARSAIGALRDAEGDSDERVRTAAGLALKTIESDRESCFPY